MFHSAVAVVTGCNDPHCRAHHHNDDDDDEDEEEEIKLSLHARYTNKDFDIDICTPIFSPPTLTFDQFTKDTLDFLFLDDVSPEDVRPVGIGNEHDYRPIKIKRKNISLEQLGLTNGCTIDFEPTPNAPAPKLCRLVVIGPDEVDKFTFPWYRAKTTLRALFEFVIESFSLQSVERGRIHLVTVIKELNLSKSDIRLSLFHLHDGMSVYVQIIPPLSRRNLDRKKLIHVQCTADQTTFHFDIANTKTIGELTDRIQRCFIDRPICDLKLFNETNDLLESFDSNRVLRSIGIQPDETIFAAFTLISSRSQWIDEKNRLESLNRSLSLACSKAIPGDVTVICEYPSKNRESFEISITKTIKNVIDAVQQCIGQKRLEIAKIDSKNCRIDLKKDERRRLADLGLKDGDTICVTIIDKSPVHKSIISNKSSESSTEDKPVKVRRPKNMPLGLDNLGNSCYMNSALQCLAHIPSLTNFFVEGFRNAHLNDGEHTDYECNPFDAIGDVTGAYADLLWAIMKYGGEEEDEEEYSFKPTRMKEQLGRKNARFATDDQQDVQEFLTFFLDVMHEEFKDKNQNRRDTKINELFFGQLTSTITCTACNKDESTTHPISFLSIPLDRHERKFCIHFIPKKGESTMISIDVPLIARVEHVLHEFSKSYGEPDLYYYLLPTLADGEIDLKMSMSEILTDELIFMEHETRLRDRTPEPLRIPRKRSTLEDCLQQFFSKEQLQETRICSQESCKKKATAIKQLTLSTLPSVLIIQFKRFSHANGLHHKVETFVEYPLEGLDLNQCLPKLQEAAIYDLVAVSAHMGSIGGGHYIAYAKHTTGNKTEWYKFDDSYVSRVRPNNYPFEIVSRDAYLLFYVRRNLGTYV